LLAATLTTHGAIALRADTNPTPESMLAKRIKPLRDFRPPCAYTSRFAAMLPHKVRLVSYRCAIDTLMPSINGENTK